MIQVQDICFAIGKNQILDRVSTYISSGEVLAICGPNGAGKSTLLRMISGEGTPTTGQVFIKEKSLQEWSAGRLAKTRAVLHQESYLTFPFPVHEVVRLGRFPYNTVMLDDDIVQSCLKKVGMQDLAHRKYTTLSGGEKQRVHLARALAQLEEEGQKEKILMLDEPTSALDLPHQEAALRIATQYAKERNHCVIIVLHDLNLAAAWADRILFLRKGKAYCEGTPEEVLTSDVIAEIYGLKTHILTHPDTKRPLVIIDRGSEQKN